LRGVRAAGQAGDETAGSDEKCSMNFSVQSEVAGAGLMTMALPTAKEAAA
jgi:hypothetical protein